MLPNAKFRALCKIEPALSSLYEQARKTPQSRWYGYFDSSGHGHPGLVERLETTVGFSAKNRDPRLTSPEAYALCYSVIHSALRREKRFTMPSIGELLTEARKR